MTDEEIEERKEYIKATTTVREVLQGHGISVKHNRCRGFCHNGKDYNMKVFRTGCHCFVCGRSFDVFDITMELDHCDFWTAFELLGGTEKLSFIASRKAKTVLKERNDRIEQQRREELILRGIRMHITIYRRIIATTDPFSDQWCYAQNQLPYQLHLLETYNEKGELPCRKSIV